MISDAPAPVLVNQNQLLNTIRPFAASALQAIAFQGDTLIAIDTNRGFLLKLDPRTNNTVILNPHTGSDLLDVTGIAFAGDTLWLAKDNNVYFCNDALDSFCTGDFYPQHFISLPYTVNGVAVWESTLYVTCKRAGYIFVFSTKTHQEITRFYAPGVGDENITIRGEEIWISDNIEQTIYCLDRATGEIKFSLLTPFECPTGLAFHTDGHTGKETLYVAYAGEEPYIRDNPNADPNHELQYRDRTFIQALHFKYNPTGRYALSTGYLVEMSYVEELDPLDEVHLDAVEWRIALPSETDRQKIRSIDWVGLPFTEEIQDGQRVAVFKFDQLQPGDRYIFGWRAVVEVWSIKYRLTPRDVEDLPDLSKEFAERYLVDNDNLAMHTDIIQNAAKEAVGTETNILRKIYKIRNYVYDKLSYGIKPHIDPPDVALERGIGSCGEYLGILLALARLNGIACRTVGRYKCPFHPDKLGVPLEPDFNHVWMEFYIPGFGWFPMESNPDDVTDRGPYPTRFFMGLAWYHAELGKGITFESLRSKGVPVNKQEVSIGDLALNHVRFTILEELHPEIG